MWSTCCKRSSETTWQLRRQSWITSRFDYVFHITQFASNVVLVLTILLKKEFLEFRFLWVHYGKTFCFVNSNLVCEFKFAKLDILLKIKLDSGSICKYEKIKLWLSYEIYLTVHDGNHELDFYDRISNEKN